jgi:hypothetical protein
MLWEMFPKSQQPRPRLFPGGNHEEVLAVSDGAKDQLTSLCGTRVHKKSENLRHISKSFRHRNWGEPLGITPCGLRFQLY